MVYFVTTTKAVAVAFEKLAENALALTPAVIDRCIDDVAAGVGVQVEHAAALVWRRAAPSSPNLIAPRNSSDTRCPVWPSSR
jgi:hypothetical protein